MIKTLAFLAFILLAKNILTLEFDFHLTKNFQNTPQCTKFTYGHEGSSCVPGEAPTNNARCKNTLVCVNGKCQNGWYGVECTQHSHCWGNERHDEGIRCLKGKCRKEKYNGQKCESLEECFSGVCTNGKCYGKPLNAKCDPLKPVECEKGLYCSLEKGECVAQLALDKPCNDIEQLEEAEYKAGSNYRVICPGGAKCTGPKNARVCKPYRMKQIGEVCEHTTECSYGSHCVAGKCVDMNLSQDRNQHVCPGYHRNCTRHQRCICEGEALDKGRCVQIAFGTMNCGLPEWGRKWQECSMKHGCAYEPSVPGAILYDSLSVDTCMYDNCRDVARPWICCVHGNNHHNQYSRYIDLPGLDCGGGNAGAVLFVLFLLFGFVVIIVTVIIVGVYFYNRKKNTHEPLY